MSGKQWQRLDVVKRVVAGQLTSRQGKTILRLSGRQMRRLVVAYEAQGESCVIHGNKGRSPANRTSEETRAEVLKLLRAKYVGFNDTHFTEKLLEEEGLEIGRSTVQRIARAEGIAAARPRRARRHRSRREREAQAGMMLLWDGSRHEWLEGRGPVLCLMGAIEDATGELMPGAHFTLQECAAGYLKVLRAVVEEKGIPQKIYMDMHGSLKRNDEYWSMEEELDGKQRPTQVGMALETLGIGTIFALSPQAKGRVERLWGTLQDRLTSEMRLAAISTVEEANAFLEKYRKKFNQRFAKLARAVETAWRPVQPGFDIEEACSFRYEATVGNDNVVTISGIKLQIPRPQGGRSYAQARVDVHQLLNGKWRVKYQGQRIAELEVEGKGAELHARNRRKRSKASRAFREAVLTFKPPRSTRARPKAGSRAGERPRPFNHWTKDEKRRAAKASKQRRAQRPSSW